MENEIWKDVIGYKGIYQVSNLGNVRSIDRIKKGKSNSNVDIIGKLKVKQKSKRGYFMVHLYKENTHKFKSVHRLVGEAFIELVKGKNIINHINGIKTDNRVENLEWVDHSENIKHSYDNKFQLPNYGEKSCLNKITEEDAIKIKYGYSGFLQKDIAKIYGVKQNLISRIRNGKRWPHI